MLKIGSDGVLEQNKIVGIINSTDFWTGFLGLGTKGTSFNTLEETPSLLSTLAPGNASRIPSLSFGYTAGAYYRLKRVPASLTLGGYDADRFEPNNVTFTLNSDQQPVVELSSISVRGWESENITLMDTSDQALFKIDSSTPFLWIPEAVADAFERTFGLTYDNDLELYFYANQSQQDAVCKADMTFVFEMSNLKGASETLLLSLPGSALTSLSLTYGYPRLKANSSSPSVPYFPVRRAKNRSQYVLGRFFLQESYLIVDYERNNFSLSQAVFDENALSNVQLVEIPSANSSSTGSSSPTVGGLPAPALFGIAIGAVAVFFIIVSTFVILYRRKGREWHRRRRRRRKQGADAKKYNPPTRWKRWLCGALPELQSVELSSDSERTRVGTPPPPKPDSPKELSGEGLGDASGQLSTVPHSSDPRASRGPPVITQPVHPPRSRGSMRKYKFGVAHDPQLPVELPNRMSNSSSEVEPEPEPEALGPSAAYDAPFPSHYRIRDEPTIGPEGTYQSFANNSDSSSPIVSPITPVAMSFGSSLPFGRNEHQLSSASASRSRVSRSSFPSTRSRRVDATYTLDESMIFDLRSGQMVRNDGSRRFSWEEEEQ